VRAITTDIKALVGRLGPVAVKALELAVGQTVATGGAEITPDHLLRAMLDLPDCDLCASLEAAGIARVDVAARLDWHIKRLPSGHKGKPTFAPVLCLLLQDAAGLTTERVRTGHVTAAVLADPGLSAAGVAATLGALPREPRYLMASRLEDRGEVGRVVQQAAPRPAEAAPAPTTVTRAEPPKAARIAEASVGFGEAKVARVAETSVGFAAEPKAARAAEPKARVEEPKAAAGASARRPLPNALMLRARFADRLVAADEGGMTLKARVGGQETTLRIAWDTEARVLVLRIALPADPPKDEVGAAVALSTLNNALPHGAFVLDEEGRLAFRSHVFLDADGNAPVETVAYAARVCEQAAEALGDAEG